jgi:putative endonuclease
MPHMDRQALGKSGEDLACRELRRRGYEILARRYRTRVGELDIVARDGATIVFVEVKTRRNSNYGEPSEAVGLRKQHRIWLMASDYLLRRGWCNRPCRFDVVAITMGDGRLQRIEILRGAFDGR